MQPATLPMGKQLSGRFPVTHVLLAGGLLLAVCGGWVAFRLAGKPKETGDKKSAQAQLEALGGKALYMLNANKPATAVAIGNEALVNKLMSDPSFFEVVTLEPVKNGRRKQPFAFHALVP